MTKNRAEPKTAITFDIAYSSEEGQDGSRRLFVAAVINTLDSGREAKTSGRESSMSVIQRRSCQNVLSFLGGAS
jgi:hypothetical protein